MACLNIRMKNKNMATSANYRNRHLPIFACSFILFNLAFSISFVCAKNNSVLTKSQQSAANRGNSYAKSSKAAKAQVAYQPAIDQAVSVEQCIALVKSSEKAGSILVPVRRNCLNKALHIAKTPDEYFQIIACARQSQLYEITKEAIDSLIAKAETKEDLLELAHKAQSMAMNDVAHIAMDKLYVQESSTEDKVNFAKQAKLMAMEDLTRKAIKDAMDQETNAHLLCQLIKATEPLEQPDLDRKILRRAVYQIKNVTECKEVYDMAKRLGQADIVELAGFKGRKMLLIEQAKAEQGAITQQQEEEEAKTAEQAAAAANQNGKNPTPAGAGF
jgi:hypothetical protein